jgi:hypothetical protein
MSYPKTGVAHNKAPRKVFVPWVEWNCGNDLPMPGSKDELFYYAKMYLKFC